MMDVAGGLAHCGRYGIPRQVVLDGIRKVVVSHREQSGKQHSYVVSTVIPAPRLLF